MQITKIEELMDYLSTVLTAKQYDESPLHDLGTTYNKFCGHAGYVYYLQCAAFVDKMRLDLLANECKRYLTGEYLSGEYLSGGVYVKQHRPVITEQLLCDAKEAFNEEVRRLKAYLFPILSQECYIEVVRLLDSMEKYVHEANQVSLDRISSFKEYITTLCKTFNVKGE